MGALSDIVGRLKTESLDSILFGSNTSWPSDGIDMNFDIDRDIGDEGAVGHAQAFIVPREVRTDADRP
jgi:hypothetical protein